MFQQLIVGFGKAGRDLHLTCLRKARRRPEGRGLFDERIGVVDPLVASGGALQGAAGLPAYPSISDARGAFDPRRTVVHICTGPSEHYPVFVAAVSAGFRRFVVEKPFTIHVSDAREILALERESGLHVAVVSNWLSSPVTARLKAIIDGGELGALQRMVIESSKPRINRTLANGSHQTAFDVEMPHQIALALALGGTEAAVLHAECTDLAAASGTVPHMGGATIATMHGDRVAAVCHSDLGCPMRKRDVILELERGTVIGYYQTGADDNHAWVKVFGGDGRLVATDVYEDDPLSTCFIEYYRHFAAQGPEPLSSVEFNTAVVDVIARAKVLSGLLHPAGVPDAVLRGAGRSRGRAGAGGPAACSDLAAELSSGAARALMPPPAAARSFKQRSRT
ncbi:Gfo/Idh/MocA family protein [Sorangium sp. So ce542]|uniref:Gfo/Idh/MocA family protein n=1 Tax=Sorangium sp. So ce542 TaxID=3133316 RepID=UPI003F5E4B1E